MYRVWYIETEQCEHSVHWTNTDMQCSRSSRVNSRWSRHTVCGLRLLTGVLETRTSTSGVRENRPLMRDDLPTLLLPMKHTWKIHTSCSFVNYRHCLWQIQAGSCYPDTRFGSVLIYLMTKNLFMFLARGIDPVPLVSCIFSVLL